MNHTHPQYLEFVGEQIAKKREAIDIVDQGHQNFVSVAKRKELEVELSAWLAIHDGLVRHTQDKSYSQFPCVECHDEHGCEVDFPCPSLTDITTHLDKVMEQG